jgi:hypothetical protein
MRGRWSPWVRTFAMPERKLIDFPSSNGFFDLNLKYFVLASRSNQQVLFAKPNIDATRHAADLI